MIRLQRPVLPNRPKKARIHTHSAVVDVLRESVDGQYVEVVETEDGGVARTLIVSHGFSIVEAPAAPPPAPPIPRAAEPPAASNPVAPTSGTSATPDASESPWASLLSGTVKEVESKLSEMTLDEADRLEIIIEERLGSNRKGVLRALGVDVD